MAGQDMIAPSLIWVVNKGRERCIVEIYQAERNRNFQNTVSIFSVRLAAGSTVASISGHFPKVVVTNPAATSKNLPGSAILKLRVPDPC